MVNGQKVKQQWDTSSSDLSGTNAYCVRDNINAKLTKTRGVYVNAVTNCID